MQISQLVTVRRRRWRIDDIRPFDDCQLVTLTGITPPDTGVQRQILAPFDTIEPIDRSRRLRRVRPALWRRAARALLAGDTPPGCLRTVLHAGIEVMPHQLQPALAVLRGFGCRVLLADEVGLGKTIQAAIVIAELKERGAADRVLVLTPAGLREQWTSELSARFGIEARVVDAATMRRRVAEMPIGVNPWTIERAAVASIDYVKRPEVLPAVAADSWDVLVVDEAHATAGDSDRHSAVSTLASRAAFVLLLTATPHSGDRQSFAALTRLGAVDDEPLLVFRRTRSDVRAAAPRRVHVLQVQPTTAETHMHALLATYTSALLTEHDDAWLPASVLHKRAFSSAWSLARSVERRLDALTREAAADSAGLTEQLTLPLGDRDGEKTQADEPPAWPSGLGLADPARETRLLRELLASAQRAARTESKLDAIRRILRRASEPAIVFTEYRDTLLRLQHALSRPAALLHGGLTRDERAAALQDFAKRRRTLLLATDAAGEGLNLHHTCRLVINLELPWNPMRLEQRIGRVDRIGQRRVVHAFHLIAAQTGEPRILARLKDRIARAQADIGSPDPFGSDEERAIVRAVMSTGANEGPARPPVPTTTASQALLTTPDLRDEGAAEAGRIRLARSLSDPSDRVPLAPEADDAWVCRPRRAAMRAVLGHRILLLWRVGFEDEFGGIVESSCVGVEVRLNSVPRFSIKCLDDRVSLQRLLASIEPDVSALLETAATRWREGAEQITYAFTSAHLRRERAIAAMPATMPAPFQPGLFDRRAERQHMRAMAEHYRVERDRTSRLRRVASTLTLRPAAPHLLLVLVP
jgi:superfamily II DNA or RNA helicase